MNSYVKAIRAITGTFFQKLFVPIAVVIGIIMALLWALTIYLGIAVDPLWFLLLVLIVPLSIFIAAISSALWFLSGKLLPRRMTHTEKQQITSFTDKIVRLVETRATPVPILAAMVAKDVMRGKGSAQIESLINDSKSLKGDFIAIRDMFGEKTLV